MRDIDALTKRLRKKGWALIRKTRHGYFFRTPTGKIQMIPANQSDSAGFRNLANQIRRNK